jgi:hypothetical protein
MKLCTAPVRGNVVESAGKISDDLEKFASKFYYALIFCRKTPIDPLFFVDDEVRVSLIESMVAS